MPKHPRFVLRTIKDGAVKIFGSTYRPDLDASRFDGMRAAFGLYYTGGERDRKFVALWGSEEAYKDPENEAYWPGPFCDEGVFRWEWWHVVSKENIL